MCKGGIENPVIVGFLSKGQNVMALPSTTLTNTYVRH